MRRWARDGLAMLKGTEETGRKECQICTEKEKSRAGLNLWAKRGREASILKNSEVERGRNLTSWSF